jgi:hypothetical protein
MLIAGVSCLSAAVISAAFGLWALLRTPGDDPAQLVRRVVAPAQLAAALMLAAGGVVALAGPPHGALLALVISVLGALGTLAAGAWQGARYSLRRPAAATGGCCGGCACSQTCE